MATRDTGTEQLIKDTAKQIFFVEGRLHATTQEIADAAGVNRTLVNYYFRSRDLLFEQVYNEARFDMVAKFESVMTSQLGFREKVENLIDIFFHYITTHPYIEVFLITELNTKVENKVDRIPRRAKPPILQGFLKEIAAEMEKGTIKKMQPVNFFMNLFALISYPFMVKPIYLDLFGLSETAFNNVFKQRKEMIMQLLFN